MVEAVAAQQPPLFVESIYDALKACVQQLGGAKLIGAKLFPQMSVDDARRRLLDSLNPDRHEKLDPQQVIMILRLAREAGFHVAKHYIDHETGYLPSTPADPVEEQARLVTVIERCGVELQRAMTALNRLQEQQDVHARKSFTRAA